jgi:hypothetical protein
MTHHNQTKELATWFLNNQSINATNIYIMNSKWERESDPENFGARITEFGVVVGNI